MVEKSISWHPFENPSRSLLIEDGKCSLLTGRVSFPQFERCPVNGIDLS